MSEDPRQDDVLLDAYLDDQLNDVDRHAFEGQVMRDARLRAELRLQQRIDASMRRLYVVPPMPAVAVTGNGHSRVQSEATAGHRLNGDHPMAGSRSAGSSAGSNGLAVRFARMRNLGSIELRPWKLAIAALLLLAIGLVGWHQWGAPPWLAADERFHLGPQQPPREFYVSTVKRGFDPAWPCPPDELLWTTKRRFGTLVSYSLPEGDVRIEVLGSAPAHVFSKYTVAVLGRVQDRPVIVLMDRVEAEPADAAALLADRNDLSVHRRVLGKMVLYEISPLSEPHLLDRFFEAPESSLPETVEFCPYAGW